MLLKGEYLNQRLMFSTYMLNCGGTVKKQMQLKRITDRGVGKGPPAAGGYGQFFEYFCNILGNIANLCFDHILHFFRAIRNN